MDNSSRKPLRDVVRGWGRAERCSAAAAPPRGIPGAPPQGPRRRPSCHRPSCPRPTARRPRSDAAGHAVSGHAGPAAGPAPGHRARPRRSPGLTPEPKPSPARPGSTATAPGEARTFPGAARGGQPEPGSCGAAHEPPHVRAAAAASVDWGTRRDAGLRRFASAKTMRTCRCGAPGWLRP